MAIKDYLGARKNFVSDSPYEDLGFGTKNFQKAKRLINRDGSFNVVKKGRSWLRLYDAYHTLITMSWTKFFLLVVAMYLLINICFAFLYSMIGMDELSGLVGKTETEKLLTNHFSRQSMPVPLTKTMK